MKRILPAMLIAFAWLHEPSSASALPAEECDPRIDNFWHNIRCTEAWDERIRRRLAALKALQEEYQRLVDERASLERQLDAQLAIVEALEKEIEENKRELDRLSRVQITQQNARQTLLTLQGQAAVIVAGLDVAIRAKVGCDSREFERVKRDLARAREVYSDISWWSQVGSAAVDFWTIIKRNAPGWLRYLSLALDGLSIITAARADDLSKKEPDPRLIRCD